MLLHLILYQITFKTLTVLSGCRVQLRVEMMAFLCIFVVVYLLLFFVVVFIFI